MSDPGPRTREPQYQIQVDTIRERGPVTLGPMAGHAWRSDPRRLAFVLSRYKFCSKLLAGRARVLEVGCADGFGARVVGQEVGRVYGMDFDPLFVDHATGEARKEGWNADFFVGDILKAPPAESGFDGAYSLDLIEHLEPRDEPGFWANITSVLAPDAMLIVGTPNVTAYEYASEWSRQGHINNKSADDLRAAVERYFRHALIFSMNDEVVHTGFYPMAHYLFAVGIGKR